MNKPAGIAIDGVELSDHNRDMISLGFEEIGSSGRAADGTMFKYVVNRKATLSTSWDMLPGVAANTVDGALGARDMDALFANDFGTFEVTITYDDGDTQVMTMMLQSFDMAVQKRWGPIFYSCSLAMAEV